MTKDLGGPYGIGVRGSRSWATIHPGFLSGYANFGERDFTVTGGKLKAAMNTPGLKGLPQAVGADDPGMKPDELVDLYLVPGRDRPGCRGISGKYDADILGYFENGGDNKEKGNLGYAGVCGKSRGKSPDAKRLDLVAGHVEFLEKKKDAAWKFMQWAASVEHDLFGARKMDFVNPVRASVWKDGEFRDRIAKSYPGYLEQHESPPRAPRSISRLSRCSSTSPLSGLKRCRRWSPRKCRSTKASTSSRPRSTSS